MRHAHKVTITCPPVLAWERSAHHAFPQSFRAQARALLLCWHRLGRDGGGGAQGGMLAGGRAPGSSACSSSACSSSSSTAAAAVDLGSLPLDLVSLLPMRPGEGGMHARPVA